MIYLLNENLGEAGYQVIGATSGDEGLQKAKELNPFAITLDIMMPHKDGWQVLHELKNDPATRDIPVIVLTAKSLSASEATLLQESASQVIQKQGLAAETLVTELQKALAS